jgi:hypothetical protein
MTPSSSLFSISENRKLVSLIRLAVLAFVAVAAISGYDNVVLFTVFAAVAFEIYHFFLSAKTDTVEADLKTAQIGRAHV